MEIGWGRGDARFGIGGEEERSRGLVRPEGGDGRLFKPMFSLSLFFFFPSYSSSTSSLFSPVLVHVRPSLITFIRIMKERIQEKKEKGGIYEETEINLPMQEKPRSTTQPP